MMAGATQGPLRRHSDRAQGHLQHRRHPHDRAFAGCSRTTSRRRTPPSVRKLAEAGTVLHGQARDPRVRHGRTVVRPALAAGAQSVEPRAFHRRLVLRHRRGGRGGPDAGRHRLGHRRLDPRAGGAVRHRRHQAHLRPVQPRRRAAAVVHAWTIPDRWPGRWRTARCCCRRWPATIPPIPPAPIGRCRISPPTSAGREGTAHRRGAALLRDRQSGQPRHARGHRTTRSMCSSISAPRSATSRCRRWRITRPAAGSS